MNRQLYDYTTKENISPITNTEAVMTPSGQTAEQRNTEQMNAIKGMESIGDASVYPFLHVGNYTLEGANAKLNSLFQTTNSKYQGRLKLVVDEQTLWVEQYAINLAEGKWMQVAYGPFTVASDNRSLVRENTKVHISYRKNDGSADVLWKDFSVTGISLKTINGQSIVGEGNINITEQGMVVLDTALDSASENGVQNKVICNAINLVKNRIASLERKEAMLPFKDVLDLGFSPECQTGGFDGSGGSIVYDPLEKRFLISIDSDTYFSAWSAMGDRASSNDYNPQIGFYYTTIRDENNKENHSLRIYHWSRQKGNLVSTDEWIDRYFSAIICPQYWGDEYPENGVLGNYWYNPTTNILYQYRETKDGKVWEQVETLQRILCNPNTSELIAQINGEDPYRLLTEKDLDNIEGRLEVILVKHWEGEGPTGWTVGDYALDDDVLKVCTAVTGDVPTLEVVDAAGKVLILCNDINRKLYQYVDGDVPEQIALIKDLKSIKSIVTPKYWGDTPGDAQVNWSKGDYWLDTSSNKLRVCTMAGSGPEALFDGANLGRILVRDSAGKLYDMDNSTGIGPRLLNENDLSDINTKINKLPGEKAYPFEGIVNSILGYEAELPTKVGKVVYVKKSSKGNPLNKFLLEVEVSTTPKSLIYYSKWNANHTALGLDSSIYANVYKNLWYTVDSSRLIIYHWSSSDNGLVPTGGGTSDVLVKTEGNTLSINNNNISFATVNGQPVLNGSAIVIEGEETEVIPTDNPLYPEYYLTAEEKANIKYAPEYHKWPLVWYGGEVSNVELQPTAYSGKVFAPGECMYNCHKMPEAFINNHNVRYDTERGYFVLAVWTFNEAEQKEDDPKYYNDWANAFEYNNYIKDSTGKINAITPITHRIYVNHNKYSREPVFISKTESGITKIVGISNIVYTTSWGSTADRPITKYWDGNNWIEPFSNDNAPTDFFAAFKACLAKNNGNMALLPNRFYYVNLTTGSNDVTSSIRITSKRDFTIEGNGSGILVRNFRTGQLNNGHVQKFFTFERCSHGGINNLSIVSLRDNITGTPSPSTEPRFCCTSSNMGFVALRETNNDMRFEDIYTFGMDCDMDIKPSNNGTAEYVNRNIFFHNIKSVLMCGNTVTNVDNLVIDGYDVLQDGYANGGEHVVYFQPNTGVVTFRNSIIRASAPYRQRMISWNEGAGHAAERSMQSLTFENCDISSACFIAGAKIRNKLSFINCTLRATSIYSGNTSAALVANTEMCSMYQGDCDVIGCTIIVPRVFLIADSSQTQGRLRVENCRFVRNLTELQTKNGEGFVTGYTTSLNKTVPFFKGFRGKYTARDNTVWYTNENITNDTGSLVRVPDAEVMKWLGLAAGTDVSIENSLSVVKDKIDITAKSVFGVDTVAADLNSPQAGERRYVSGANSKYICTATGRYSRISINHNLNLYNLFMNGYAGWQNKTYTIQIAKDEKIPLCANNAPVFNDPSNALSDFMEFICSAIEAAGYVRLPDDTLKYNVKHSDYAGCFDVVRGTVTFKDPANEKTIFSRSNQITSIRIIPKTREDFSSSWHTSTAFRNMSGVDDTNVPGITLKTTNSTSYSEEGCTDEESVVAIKITPQDGSVNLSQTFTQGNPVIISLGENEEIILHGEEDSTVTFTADQVGPPQGDTNLQYIKFIAQKVEVAGYDLDSENGEISGDNFVFKKNVRPTEAGSFSFLTVYSSRKVDSDTTINYSVWYLLIKAKNKGYSWDYARTHNARYYSSEGQWALYNTGSKFYIMGLLGSSYSTSTLSGKADTWIRDFSYSDFEQKVINESVIQVTVSDSEPQEPRLGWYWFEIQDNEIGQLKRYTGVGTDGWENVSGTRILYDAGDGQTSQRLYLCINGTSIKRITLTNV